MLSLLLLSQYKQFSRQLAFSLWRGREGGAGGREKTEREEERRREKKRRRKRDRQEGEAGEKEEHDTATHRTIFPIISHVFHNPPFSLQLFLSTNTTRTHSHTVIASPSHNARSPLNTAQHSTQHTASSTQCLPRHCCSWCWQPL